MPGVRHKKDESQEEYEARRAEWQATKGDRAPAGQEPKSPAERRSLLADVRAWLLSVNQFLIKLAPEDALSERPLIVGTDSQGHALVQEAETERLAVAFDAWQASSPKIHKAVQKALAASPGVALLVCCVGIALPRLERRGMLPWATRAESYAGADGGSSPGGPVGSEPSPNGAGPEQQAYGATPMGAP